MLRLAFALLAAETDVKTLDKVRKGLRGEARAVFAGKGPERTSPWIVVDDRGYNLFGRLWAADYARAIASMLNEDI